MKYFRLDELPPDEDNLTIKARAAAHNSHSLSGYCVGAALKTYAGIIVVGTNYDNPSPELNMCAARTAVWSANNIGRRDIWKLAIAGRRTDANSGENCSGQNPFSPCRDCLQVIKVAEDLAGKPIIILMDAYNDRKIARVVGVSELMPLAFGPADLGISLDE